MGRILLLAAGVGVVAGFGAIGFTWIMETIKWLLMDHVAGYRPAGPAHEVELFAPTQTEFRRWALLFLPALGGLVSGLIVFRFAPEAAGHGTDAAIEAYHFRDGAVRARVPLIKAITSAITIGSGGSAGREGPIAQIGAGFGSTLAHWLKLSGIERRTLMAAGMSAGIGAIFHAPLAGALFAAEVLYKDMDLEHEIIIPAFISSILSYSIFAIRFGWEPLFATPDFVFQNPAQLGPYLVLAGALALGAIVYIKTFYSVEHVFKKLRLKPHFKPMIGGLLTGLIGFFLPQALGSGYGTLQTALSHGAGAVAPLDFGLADPGLTRPALVLLVIALGKIATTSFSIGSGGSGGVFGPAVVIGGCIGGAVGLVFSALFPWMEIETGSFVVVGMAGFFAAAANCPISTIIMVSEMTGNYHLLVPAMLVCVVAYLLARKYSLYANQLQSRLEAPSKMGNMLSAVLRKITVQSAMDELLKDAAGPQSPVTIPESMSLSAMIQRFANSDQTCFPVMDSSGELCGVVMSGDIRRVLHEPELADLIVARDLAKPVVTLSPKENLLIALAKMTAHHQDELVVVDDHRPTVPLATLDRGMIVRAYDKALFASAE